MRCELLSVGMEGTQLIASLGLKKELGVFFTKARNPSFDNAVQWVIECKPCIFESISVSLEGTIASSSASR